MRVVGLVLVVALVAGACGSGEGDLFEGSSGSSTSLSGAPVEVGFPTDPLVTEAVVVTDVAGDSVVVQVAPGDHGVEAIEIFVEGTDRGSMVVWRESGGPVLVEVDGDVVMISDPEAGSIEIVLEGERLVGSLVTADGVEDVVSVDVPDVPQALAAPEGVLAAYRPVPALAGEARDHTASITGRVVVVFGVESRIPTPVYVRVEGCPEVVQEGLRVLECSGFAVGSGPQSRLELVFGTEVDVSDIPVGVLEGEAAAAAAEECEGALSFVSTKLGEGGAYLSAVSLLVSALLAKEYALLAGATGLLGLILGIGSLDWAPESVTRTCLDHVVRRTVEGLARDEVAFVGFPGVSLRATPVLPDDWEVVDPVVELPDVYPWGELQRITGIEFELVEKEPNGEATPDDPGTALARIAPGTYEGMIDTTGAFRDGVTVTSAGITLTVTADGAAVDWAVEWSEDAGECVTTGSDWWSGSEVTLDADSAFSIRGSREFRPGADSTCDLGAEPSSFERTFRFDVDGTTVTGDIGVGIATIEIGD